jgi:N-methylhydantoinase A
MPRAASPDAAPTAKRRRPIFTFIGVDTGGTFTDFVCFRAGRLRVHKLPSTPDDPSRAVLQGLRDLLSDSDAPQAVDITYGSTVATNALLERRGSRVVLLTTAGFEDLLEIARQTRPDIYALEPRKPEPLLGRSQRAGVAERTTFDGRILVPLSPAAVKAARAAVRRLRAESVAVCFLHSYANARHERAIGRAVRDLGIPC